MRVLYLLGIILLLGTGNVKAQAQYEVRGLVTNATTGSAEKIGKLYTLCGKKQTELTEATAGDIVVASKISANTGNTLCDSSRIVEFGEMEFPRPCYSMTVKAKAQGDEAKISTSIQRLIEEDPTLTYEQDDVLAQILCFGAFLEC